MDARHRELAVIAHRRWLVALSVVPVALGLASCGGSSGQRTASAVFSDVEDLSNGAQVQLADVPVGHVTSISLDGDRARITMDLVHGVSIPANVTAALDRTTILGQQFINLEVPKNEVGSGRTDVAQLPDGAAIRHTTIVPDVEQLVQAGAEVFGAVSTTELEQIIAAGGEGFTGQEASLKAFLSDITSVTGGYAQHTSEITEAVNGLDKISATLAPNSSANANALTTLSQTVAILAQQSTQFENLLQSIDNLSVQGRGILETYYPQIVAQLKTLQAASSELSQNQGDLAGILEELPLNNSALPSSVRSGYLQLYENIIICGVPGGGEDDSSPAFTCAPTTGANSK
jgi:phospholipid/cholesterol/gamma-HCH transport system substrate-binding protein